MAADPEPVSETTAEDASLIPTNLTAWLCEAFPTEELRGLLDTFYGFGNCESYVMAARPFSDLNFVLKDRARTPGAVKMFDPATAPAFPFPVFPPPASHLRTFAQHPRLARYEREHWLNICGHVVAYFQGQDPDFDPYITKKRKGMSYKPFDPDTTAIDWLAENGAEETVYTIWKVTPITRKPTEDGPVTVLGWELNKYEEYTQKTSLAGKPKWTPKSSRFTAGGYWKYFIAYDRSDPEAPKCFSGYTKDNGKEQWRRERASALAHARTLSQV